MAEPVPANDIHYRRWRRFSLSADFALMVVKGAIVEVVDTPVPMDAEIRNVFWDSRTGRFDVIIWSSTFEPVLDGHVIPELDPPRMRLWSDRRQMGCK